MKKKHLIILVLIIAAALRLVSLTNFPAGFNADEAAIGYNAYSLIKTGLDEHGNAWPLSFRSFDDFKPPLYFYLTLPFVKFLGLSVMAVRLPAALLGIATVYLVYLLVNRLFADQTLTLFGQRLTPGLIAAWLLAVSPWHLHFSRGGWEVNAATFFLVLALWLALRALDRPKMYLGVSLSLLASVYTYHSLRVIVPLLVVAFLLIYWPKFKKHLTSPYLYTAVALTILLAIPIITQFFSGTASSRFSGVSLFADSGPLWQALEMRRQHLHASSLWVRALHNQYLSYLFRFLQNYLSHFAPYFLFLTGDVIARSKVPGLGQSYLFLSPFLVLGLVWAVKKLQKPAVKLLLCWFFIAPLAAALTFQSPHALRSQNMVVPLSIITALGLIFSLNWLKQHSKLFFKLSSVVLGLMLIYNTASWAHQYVVHYPQKYPYAWEYGFEQLVDYLKPRQNDYQKIIITDEYDQPYILTAFFLKYPPSQLQQTLEFTSRDKFGFSTGRSFGHFIFKDIDWDTDSQNKNTLIVSDPESAPAGIKPDKTIYYPHQEPVFIIYSTDKI